jgi:hypothetical protein
MQPINETGVWNFIRRIGAMVLSMAGKDMNCSYVKNVSFMPGDIEKRASR